MKPFIQYFGLAIFAGLAALVMISGACAQDASTCYTIGDADARTYCLARARKDSGMCYAIHRADMRAQCLAEVRK